MALITERDRKNGAGNPAQSLTERKAMSIRSGSGFNRCSSIGSTHRRVGSLQEEKFNPSMTERLFSSVVIGLWENSRQRGYLGGPWAAYF